MTKYGLLIGINYIGTSNALHGCINDVLNMKRWLLFNRGFEEQNLVMMCDDKKLAKLPELHPTRANILKQIALAVAKLKSGDELFLHYSGHGSYMKDTNGDEPDGQDECICPVDMNFIIDDELREALADKIPNGAKLRCLFDCCYSGSNLDCKLLWLKGEKFQNEGAKAKQSKDILAISGCTDHQTSADAYVAGMGQGAMTWSFLEVMHIHQDWTWAEVITGMRLKLLEGRYDQIPQLSVDSRKLIHAKFDI